MRTPDEVRSIWMEAEEDGACGALFDRDLPPIAAALVHVSRAVSAIHDDAPRRVDVG